MSQKFTHTTMIILINITFRALKIFICVHPRLPARFARNYDQINMFDVYKVFDKSEDFIPAHFCNFESVY